MIATLADAVDALDDIVDYAYCVNDPAGYFAAIYRAVTAAERKHLHEFDHPERMERFAVDFADRYLAAFASRGWAGAFDPDLNICQSIVLPINAHVCWDLGHTLAGMGDLDSLRGDYVRVEQVARPVWGASWEALSIIAPRSRWLRRATPFALWPALLTHFRARAWRFGAALQARPDQAQRLCAQQLSYTAKMAARWRAVLAPLRAGESVNVAANLTIIADCMDGVA